MAIGSGLMTASSVVSVTGETGTTSCFVSTPGSCEMPRGERTQGGGGRVRERSASFKTESWQQRSNLVLSDARESVCASVCVLVYVHTAVPSLAPITPTSVNVPAYRLAAVDHEGLTFKSKLFSPADTGTTDCKIEIAELWSERKRLSTSMVCAHLNTKGEDVMGTDRSALESMEVRDQGRGNRPTAQPHSLTCTLFTRCHSFAATTMKKKVTVSNSLCTHIHTHTYCRHERESAAVETVMGSINGHTY